MGIRGQRSSSLQSHFQSAKTTADDPWARAQSAPYQVAAHEPESSVDVKGAESIWRAGIPTSE